MIAVDAEKLNEVAETANMLSAFRPCWMKVRQMNMVCLMVGVSDAGTRGDYTGLRVSCGKMQNRMAAKNTQTACFAVL